MTSSISRRSALRPVESLRRYHEQFLDGARLTPKAT
jgi:hypothetical protein